MRIWSADGKGTVMARIGYIAFIMVFLKVLPTMVVAQESAPDLAASAGNDLRLLQAFQSLERATNQMDHYVAYGIIASAGGWLVIDAYGDNPVSNSYVIRNNADDQAIEVARAGATVARSKTATETDKKNAEAAVSSIGDVLETALVIADLLEAEDLDAAASLYREKSTLSRDSALGAVQTANSNIQIRLGKTLTAIRLIK